MSQAKPVSGLVLRLAVVSGVGTAVLGLSLSTLAGLVFLATSLTSPPDFVPHAHKAATPDRLALAAAFYAPPSSQACRSNCEQRSQYIVQQAKAPRTANIADTHLDAAWLAREATRQRFERARAPLSHAELASAFAQARAAQLALAAPSKDRFHPVQLAALTSEGGPAASRFSAKVPEIERSSRLALALAGSGTLDVNHPIHTASLEPAMPLLTSEMIDGQADVAFAPDFEAAPDSAPLPARRPKLEASQPAAIAEAAPRRQTRTKPARQRQSEPQALAYAAPGDGAPSIGQAFKNLFSSSPNAGNGVAVYDISAQTVTMPDGQVLEAHSGIGHMADDPRYVNQKMNGPTPPNTYKLVMRESRFHGVEAIRMLPVDGKNKYGRDGILAHSYLLRGRAGQSHGCVAFADYERFLKAFKQGKVKHMVVVPGRSSRSSTRIAKNGSGA